MKKNGKNGKFNLRSIAIAVLVILFFEGVISVYYSMLYSETRERIIKNGELSSETSAEQINRYLAKGTDTIKLVCYTLDNMIRSGKSQEEILDFLVNQSDAVVETATENSTGIYGYINGEYVDGTGWVPDEDFVPTDRPWYIGARANVGRVAIDAKDKYTNGHSSRVADYAKEIGRRFGYSQKQQDEIHIMGLLHDVGKLVIPDAVINKPGDLTEEEFAVIRTHPLKGYEILSKTTEMPQMAVGARWHHERYDGKGYPDGLVGGNIAEEARIIAVADAYDAMTSRRSYRDALPQDVVREEIEKGKGTQFDPVFANIMLRMMSEDKDYEMRAKDADADAPTV